MREYGMQPHQIGLYTTAEIAAVIEDQDEYHKALRQAQHRQ